MQMALNIVPTTAKRRIVPKWSKKSRLGMKYPASNIMGGNIQKKKMVDDRGDNTGVFVAYKMPPMANPTTTRQQVSGNQANNFGQPFTTENENKKQETMP